MNKRILFIVLASLTILIAAIFILTPFYITHYVNENGKELTGRKISIDRFYFNILNGNSRIENFKMYEENDQDIFVKFDTLKINLTIYKLFAKELYIEELKIYKPKVKVVSNNMKFNFDSLISSDSTQTDSTTTSSESPFIKYSLNNFSIISGDIIYNDLDENISHGIEDFNVKLPHIAWGENNTDAGLEFSLSEGGKFTTSIHYENNTGDYKWNVNIKDLNLNEFLPYAKKEIKLSELEGKLYANINIKGNIETIDKPFVEGEIGVNEFSMVDEEKFEFINFEHAKINSKDIDLKNMKFYIDSLYINKLNLSYEVYEEITNIDRLFYEQAQDLVNSLEDSTTINDEGDNLKWKISNLLVENSKINFYDYSLKPEAFKYSLSNIHINAENIEYGNRAKIIFLSNTPKGGKFNAEVVTDPNNLEDGQFNLFLKNVDTKEFSPYCLYYFGYPLKGGKYNFSIKNNVKNNYIKSRMVIDAYSTKLGDKRKDFKPEYKVPLKTALVILQDKDKRINFDIPVEGDLDDPSFKYGKIILKVFTDNLVKLVVSPFRFLAKSLGVSEDEIKEVKLDILQLELGPSQTTQLDVIANLLKEKNPLKAEVQLYVDKEDEMEELISVRAKSYYYLKGLYNNDTLFSKLTIPDYSIIRDIDIEDVDFGTYLANKLNLPKDSLNNDSMCKLLVQQKEADSIFNLINKIRIKNIENYLSKKDSIIYKVKPEVIDKSITGNKPYFEMKYILEE